MRLGLTDYGRTVALGDYEASADAILYELDPVYRRSVKKLRRQSEKTFGASLRALVSGESRSRSNNTHDRYALIDGPSLGRDRFETSHGRAELDSHLPEEVGLVLGQ